MFLHSHKLYSLRSLIFFFTINWVGNLVLWNSWNTISYYTTAYAKYREIDMDFTLFGSCLIKKFGAIFVNFSTLMSAIYRILIYVLDDNIASVVLFQNLGNLKTNTTKIPVLVLYKLSLLHSFFLDCFIRKIATICSIPWFSTFYISKSSTQWHI